MSPVDFGFFWSLPAGVYRRARTLRPVAAILVIFTLKYINRSKSGASFVLTIRSSLGTSPAIGGLTGFQYLPYIYG